MFCSNQAYRKGFRLLLIALLSSFTLAVIAQKPILKEYTVQKGETVYSIAKRNGLKEQDIYRHNPGSEMGIREGQTLLIPQLNAKLPNTIENVPPTHLGTYTVVAGDTFYAVARKFNISPAILRQYNPDIDPDQLRPGMVLRVAMPDGTSIEAVSDKVVVIGANGLNTVRVALLLPVNGSGPDRYVRFYEGFLMGVEELRKNGISMDVYVYQTPSTADLHSLMSQSASLEKADLLIGGQSEAEVNMLADYTGKKGITYVSPFIAAPLQKSAYARNYFRLNTPQEELYPALGRNFAHFIKGKYKPVFVTVPGANHAPVVAALQKALAVTNMKYESIKLSELTPDRISRLSAAGAILVPNDGKQATLSKMLDLLDAQGSTSKKIRLFGYPEWQSYQKNLLRRLGGYKGTIYTTFFYDNDLDKESERFRKSYIAWFGKNLDHHFPKYSVLGYDVARFFIRAMATYGAAFPGSLAQLPTDGLQNDFNFKAIGDQSAYSSVNVFFVTYDANGGIVRRKMSAQ